ncbi:MDM20/NAA25 family protein [Sporobolomyces koalae]|uniref:MDM20/NAA25 family protein n=1 Tax=Sporobolomyces koalae TaxID=500713 RepID=UPI0031722905
MAELSSLVRSFYSSRQGRLNLLDNRSIGTICTALERRDVKKALLDCQTLLKRRPNEPSGLALKLVALSLASKPLTASSQQDWNKSLDAVTNNPTALGDSEIVMALSFALRNMGKSSEAVELLTRAARDNSGNEELAQEAFIQMIRMNEILKAQELSLQMTTSFASNPDYILWSIMTIILQIRTLQHPETETLLALAEKQATEYFESSTEYKTADEFHVATRLLELRAQFSPSPSTYSPPRLPSVSTATNASLNLRSVLLDHFVSSEGDKWCERNLGFELWSREATLRFGGIERGEWQTLWQRLERKLEAGDTNWHTMLYLIRAACSIAASSSTSYYADASTNQQATNPNPQGLETLKETRKVFEKLAQESPKAKVERGFLLGLLEISRECLVRSWNTEESLEPLVLRYLEQFGGKMCCFDDLLPYLGQLSTTEARVVRERAREIATKKDQLVREVVDVPSLRTPQLISSRSKQTMDDARRVINALKIDRYLSDEQTAEEEVARAQDYLERYFSALSLGKALPPTELQPADDFALLSAQAYVSAYHSSHDRSHLERAAAVLDHALRSSKYKYQSRILLINLYRLLGASSLSLQHYRLFGVKNIQYDTLSHLVLHRGSTYAIESGKELGVHEEAIQTERWYKMGQNEAAQMSVQTFTLPNYGKVEDFAEFRLRLDQSLEKSLSALEVLRTRLLRGVLDTPLIDEAVVNINKIATSTKTLFDNRDFKTLPNFQAHGSASVWDQTALGGRNDVEWLRAFATIYSRFLSPSQTSSEPTPNPSSFTRSEAALFSFSASAQRALVAPLDQATDAEQAALVFFKDQATLFSTCVEDTVTLPWELVQIASVSLEAFSLLELGIEQRLDEMAANKLPDQSKHSKRFRALRTAARDGLRQVGQQLTAHSKKIAKDRSKIVAGLNPLTTHEALNEDSLTNFAHALVESRKVSTEGLAATIHRRTAK